VDFGAKVNATAPARRPKGGQSGSQPCLVVEGLTIEVTTDAGTFPVVEDINLVINQGETLGLVGESGSGKTVTSLALMRLLPSPPFTITGGHVWLDGRDLLSLDFNQMRQVRGGQISMIFQDPMSSLNPARAIGAQLAESIRLHDRCSRESARRQAVELLDRVGLPDPRDRVKWFPHQLSGGMRQRVMIAMALSSHPRLFIADEPTTALDVTVQAQILDLLRDFSRSEHLSVLFVTHDLGVVAELCDRVAVMYGGQVVETASTTDLFTSPTHPYTEGLIAASRTAGADRRMSGIPGQVPAVGHAPEGCRFHPRCSYATDRCQEDQALESIAGDLTRQARCWQQSQLSLKGTA
jgi:oligopeptide/dipeptide ABC transporter ATP-binding protein